MNGTTVHSQGLKFNTASRTGLKSDVVRQLCVPCVRKTALVVWISRLLLLPVTNWLKTSRGELEERLLVDAPARL